MYIAWAWFRNVVRESAELQVNIQTQTPRGGLFLIMSFWYNEFYGLRFLAASFQLVFPSLMHFRGEHLSTLLTCELVSRSSNVSTF